MTTAKERPILFQAPMVRALLDGRRTVTRRVMNPQPVWNPIWGTARGMTGAWIYGSPRSQGMSETGDWWSVLFDEEHQRRACTEEAYGWGARSGCPFGQPGDRLWVRETWWNAEAYPGSDQNGEAMRPSRSRLVHYAADGDPPNTPNRCYPTGLRNGAFAAPDPWAQWVKRPSIHMPRWASRLTLRVVAVSVERLHDITEEDCIHAGIREQQVGTLGALEWGATADASTWRPDPRSAFRALWESNNGAESWDVNPWVWRVEFKRVDPKEGA